MEPYLLSTLNTYIRRVIGINFQEALWIRAEITQCNLKSGNYYLELVEKSESGEITAQGNAIIWKSQADAIFKEVQIPGYQFLKPGHEFVFKALVDYHIRYGLKLIIQEVSKEFIAGQLAIQRRNTLELLKREGLWQRNKTLSLPIPVLRIALIASKASAAYADFTQHLVENVHGFTYLLDTFNVNVQGQSSVADICSAFQKIEKRRDYWDVVVLIRGGGSKHDLADFDHFELAKSISLCKCPVLTGIGHQTDESIADLSACISLKTPTAVADWIIQHTFQIDQSLNQIWVDISTLSFHQLQHKKLQINEIESRIYLYSERHFGKMQLQLSGFWSELQKNIARVLYAKLQQINELEQFVQHNDPANLLERGYSISTINGVPIHRSDSLQAGAEMTTIYLHGKIKSTIIETWPNEN